MPKTRSKINKAEIAPYIVSASFVGIAVATSLIVYFLTKKPKPIEFPSLCPQAERLAMYVFLNDSNKHATISAKTALYGHTIQNAAQPTFYLCSSGGTAKNPIYQYVNKDNAETIKWGTSVDAPSGYIIGNNGLSYGYVYEMKQLGSETLVPLYVLEHEFEQSNVSILSTSSTKTYGGATYHHKKILGYTFQ